MSELKPCPFCGSQDVVKVIEGTRHPMIYVRCNTCLSMSGWYEPDEENIMVSAWNKRVGEQMKKKLVLFSEDDHTAMISLVKDSIIEIDKTLERQYVPYNVYIVKHKLNEILSILNEEGD